MPEQEGVKKLTSYSEAQIQEALDQAMDDSRRRKYFVEPKILVKKRSRLP
jgi:hypothetical protein